MARIYPERVHPNTQSHAERILYERLRDDLPHDYTVFHSVAWLARSQRGGARDGEADFVIAHPAEGLLVVEVKGGTIRYDGHQAQWYSHHHPIKDPFEQAKRNKYSLLDKLRDLPYWRSRWVSLGHAVAFPDCMVPQDLRLDAPDTIILDRAHLHDVKAWVTRAMAFWRGESEHTGSLGSAGVEQLVRLFSPSWELRTPMAMEFEDEASDIIRLTEEQFQVLDLLSTQRRAAIAGCAGSGKTTLAIEKARRLAEQGFRVLLTCYNRSLAEYLRSDETIPTRVDVRHFHGVCVKLVRDAGMGDRLAGGWNTEDWYDETLPDLLMEALDRIGPQYDAIIVDEGQDIQESWWIPLLYLLKEPESGVFYVFYDDNQNLYQGDLTFPENFPRFPLTLNCRNTQWIHRAFLPFYRSPIVPHTRGPEGRAPEILFYENDHKLKEQLRRTLHRLTYEEQIWTEDIVILTPRSPERSLLGQWDRLGNLRLTEQWPPASGEVFVTTVHSYKGLESPVVILADLRGSDHLDLETILYVSCSRARNHLVILADASLPHSIKEHLSH